MVEIDDPPRQPGALQVLLQPTQHSVAALRRVPDSVGPTGTDWVFAGSLRFPGGVLAQFDCATALTDRDELEAIGSEGSLFLDDPWHCRTPVIELRRGGGVERIELDPEDSYQLELENLAEAIAGEAPPLLGRQDAVAQARVIEALHRSAETRAPTAL